jgi:hypothetical protein
MEEVMANQWERVELGVEVVSWGICGINQPVGMVVGMGVK